MAVIDTQDLLALLAVGATLQEVADWAIAQPESARIPFAWHYRDHNPPLAEPANGFTTDPNTAAAMGGRPLYTAPPAQAVDLGQFREAIESLKDAALHDRDPGPAVNAYNRVLALVDSKA